LSARFADDLATFSTVKFALVCQSVARFGQQFRGEGFATLSGVKLDDRCLEGSKRQAVKRRVLVVRPLSPAKAPAAMKAARSLAPAAHKGVVNVERGAKDVEGVKNGEVAPQIRTWRASFRSGNDRHPWISVDVVPKRGR
jgi:hypothetical protein